MSTQPGHIDAVGTNPELRRNALGLSSVLFQGITHIGPAIGIVFTVPFIALYAGTASPFAFFFAIVIMLMVANTVSEFSKYMPSAGGYFTFVSKGLGKRFGFMTAWSYFAYDPLGPPAVLGFMGYLAAAVLKSGTGVSVPWWVFAVAGLLFTWFLIYRGITVSVRTSVVLGTLEVLIMIALAVTFLLHPAHSYSWTAPLNPANYPPSKGFSGILYGVVFCLLALSGFESVAPLARETREPRKLLPRAVFGSLILVGILFVFATYASVAGWGVGNMHAFAVNANPYYFLAKKLWGGAWILVFIAIVNSVLADCIATGNAVTRVTYGMGMSGALNPAIAKIHPKYRTPARAVTIETIVVAALTIGVGLWVTPAQIYGFLGDIITVAIIVMYSLANIALYFYMRREHRDNFSIWRHALVPALGTLLVLPVLWVTFHPAPPYPFNLVPYIVIVWLIIGAVFMIWNERKNGARVEAMDAAFEAMEKAES